MTSQAPAPVEAITDDAGQRCGLTELLVDQCGHCRHPRPPRRPCRPTTHLFAARFPGLCADCGDPYLGGDEITWSDDANGYVCGGCAE